MKLIIERMNNAWATLLLFLAAISGTAVDAQVVPLDTVLANVRRNNPMLQEYERRIAAREAYTEGATAWMAPMVGVGPFWYPYSNEKVMGPSEEGMVMAVVEQSIPNPAKQKAKRNFMAYQSRVEAEAQAVKLNELRAEAKKLYYQTVVSERQLAVLEESRKIIELMLKLEKIRYPYNQGNLGSLYKAEGRLHEVGNMQLMVEGNREENLAQLASLMNTDGQGTIQVDTTISPTFDPARYSTETQLESVRSDVRQIDRSIEAMRLNQIVQKRESKPDFKFRFEHMEPRNSVMPRQFSAMAMITIPIAPWSSKMYRSEIKGMQSEIEAMEKEREGVLLEARGMIASMKAQLSRMQQQLENYRAKIIPALRRNYDVQMLAYQENQIQLPAVIDAWEAYNMAQLEYLDRQLEFYTMIVNYEKELEL